MYLGLNCYRSLVYTHVVGFGHFPCIQWFCRMFLYAYISFTSMPGRKNLLMILLAIGTLEASTTCICQVTRMCM
uniref:Uncharacterized protein n=1 Tax=Arundo donax TaxID=35708 RepID=A0A0A9EPN8_ARUDO